MIAFFYKFCNYFVFKFNTHVCILEEFSFSSWSKIFFYLYQVNSFLTAFQLKFFLQVQNFLISSFLHVNSHCLCKRLLFDFLAVHLSVIKVSFTFTTATLIIALSVLVFSFTPFSFWALFLFTFIASLTVLVPRNVWYV